MNRFSKRTIENNCRKTDVKCAWDLGMRGISLSDVFLTDDYSHKLIYYSGIY